MSNKHCKCEAAGMCDRHGVKKSVREVQLCKGVNCTSKQHAAYWNAWEAGKLREQTKAVADPQPIVYVAKSPSPKGRGLGDNVSKFISGATFGLVKPCGGCKKRAATLNHWAPAPYMPVELSHGDFTIRNCLFHIWPVKGFDAWRWNCDQLMSRAHLFNGRRIVSIVTDSKSESVEVVKEYMRDFTDEFIIAKNIPRLREVVTFVPMMEQIESLNPKEITFFCHSKCVRHDIDLNDTGSTIVRWTKAMYETCLDYYPLVEESLKDYGITGSFKRHGQFRTRGNHRWHYSGTFYWYRHDEVFRRNWRYIDKRFFGAESWVGHVFKAEDAGVLFADKVDDLYVLDYWKTRIAGPLKQWKLDNERSLTSETRI